jgi:integrase
VERSWPDRRSAVRHRSPIHPDLITDWFRRLARTAGLPPIRLHDVRHSCRTIAEHSRNPNPELSNTCCQTNPRNL